MFQKENNKRSNSIYPSEEKTETPAKYNELQLHDLQM